MKNTTFCRQKHQKIPIFQNQAGANAPPLPPFPNDVPGGQSGVTECRVNEKKINDALDNIQLCIHV